MPAQGSAVGQHNVIANLAVMSHMRIDHEKVLVADTCYHPTAAGPGVERGELANDVVVADGEDTVLALVLLILRDGADAGELKNAVLTADGGATFDDRVRSNLGVLADPHLRTNHRVGANLHAAIEFCSRRHYS